MILVQTAIVHSETASYTLGEICHMEKRPEPPSTPRPSSPKAPKDQISSMSPPSGMSTADQGLSRNQMPPQPPSAPRPSSPTAPDDQGPSVSIPNCIPMADQNPLIVQKPPQPPSAPRPASPTAPDDQTSSKSMPSHIPKVCRVDFDKQQDLQPRTTPRSTSSTPLDGQSVADEDWKLSQLAEDMEWYFACERYIATLAEQYQLDILAHFHNSDSFEGEEEGLLGCCMVPRDYPSTGHSSVRSTHHRTVLTQAS